MSDSTSNNTNKNLEDFSIGWKCPICGKVNAPFIHKCDCCKKVEPIKYVPYPYYPPQWPYEHWTIIY